MKDLEIGDLVLPASFNGNQSIAVVIKINKGYNWSEEQKVYVLRTGVKITEIDHGRLCNLVYPNTSWLRWKIVRQKKV